MTPYPELQQIIKDETDNGRGIVRFLFKAMRGEFSDFTPNHQLMAGRVLAIIGVEQGIEFVEANRPPSLPRNTPQRRILDETDAMLTAAERELADYTRKMSRSGRKMIRFFLDAMNGLVKSFRPSLRIAAARELIGYGFPLLAPARRPRTAAPGPQPAPPPQPAPAARTAPVQTRTAHADSCSCAVCVGNANSEYTELYGMKEDELIYEFILRKSAEFGDDPHKRLAVARALWIERNGFIKARCPGFYSIPFPERLVVEMIANENLLSEMIELATSDYDDTEDCDCEDCAPIHRDDDDDCLCDLCFDTEDNP